MVSTTNRAAGPGPPGGKPAQRAPTSLWTLDRWHGSQPAMLTLFREINVRTERSRKGQETTKKKKKNDTANLEKNQTGLPEIKNCRN